MTDFRALCADLLRELDHASEWDYQQALKDQARAALAEAEPVADGEVAELVADMRQQANYAYCEFIDKSDLIRAAELLERMADGPAVQSREPASVVEQPTQQNAVALYTEVMALHECKTLGEMAEHFASAVLARWGNPASQPIPVSERLPEAGDCDAEGKCWWLSPETAVDFGAWTYGTVEVCSKSNWVDWGHTHWLPFNSLPLPSGEVE